MNPPMLRRWIDEFHATSVQQWAFLLVAGASAMIRSRSLDGP